MTRRNELLKEKSDISKITLASYSESDGSWSDTVIIVVIGGESRIF